MSSVVAESNQSEQKVSNKKSLLGRLEERLEKWSDWLNPLLIKEVRRSLKSRQFSLTLTLLVIATIFVTFVWGGYASDSGGQGLLAAYLSILAFAGCVIIPFTVAKSVADEYTERTLELELITTLRPSQIAFGKLAVAATQLSIFVSMLTPCAVLTYILESGTPTMIVLHIVVLVLISLFITTIGIALTSVATNFLIRSLVVFFFLFLSFFLFILVVQGVAETTRNEIELEGLPFFLWIFALIAALEGIFLSVAISAFSFASDNRSTRVRIWLSIAHFVAFGTMAEFDRMFGMDRYWFDREPALLDVLVLLWGVIGGLLIGEQSELSERARRTLPESQLARGFLFSFMPGSGAGYWFTVFHVLTVPLFAYRLTGASQFTTRMTIFAFWVLCTISLVNLIFRANRRFHATGYVGSICLTVGVFVFSMIPAFFYRPNASGFDSYQYYANQIALTFSPVAQVMEFSNGVNSWATLNLGAYIVGTLGLVLINWVVTLRELYQTRSVTPKLVADMQKRGVSAQTADDVHPLDMP